MSERPGIMLASPPSGEVLPPPNPRRTHGRSGRAAVTAGALTPERYAVDGVAADPAALDTHRDATYLDDVEHADTLDGLSEGRKSCSTSSTPLAEPGLVVESVLLVYCRHCHKTHAVLPGEKECSPGAWHEDTAPLMSTDFPGQPFGRGDTITVVSDDFTEREAVRQGRLRRWQAIR